jgi:hypothetical protein
MILILANTYCSIGDSAMSQDSNTRAVEQSQEDAKTKKAPKKQKSRFQYSSAHYMGVIL